MDRVRNGFDDRQVSVVESCERRWMFWIINDKYEASTDTRKGRPRGKSVYAVLEDRGWKEEND